MDTQSILALIGIFLVAQTARWQIGFFTLDSVRLNWKTDVGFSAGCVLIAQYYFI